MPTGPLFLSRLNLLKFLPRSFMSRPGLGHGTQAAVLFCLMTDTHTAKSWPTQQGCETLSYM